MKKENVIELIRLGFGPTHYLKRSVWVKVERVMEFLVNKNEVVRIKGEVKYEPRKGYHSNDDINRWADMYLHSPFSEHLEEMKKLSKELNLPLNSRELLAQFINL